MAFARAEALKPLTGDCTPFQMAGQNEADGNAMPPPFIVTIRLGLCFLSMQQM
jgi:hypothetical protein